MEGRIMRSYAFAWDDGGTTLRRAPTCLIGWRREPIGPMGWWQNGIGPRAYMSSGMGALRWDRKPAVCMHSKGVCDAV